MERRRCCCYCKQVSLISPICRRIVRSQSKTVPPHNFTICKDRSDEWGKIPECPIPRFAGGFPQVCLFSFQHTAEAAQVTASLLFILCNSHRAPFVNCQIISSLYFPSSFFRPGCGWLVQWFCMFVNVCYVSFVTCRQSATGRYVWFVIDLWPLSCSAGYVIVIFNLLFICFALRSWCGRPRCWSCSWWRTASKWRWVSTSSSTAPPSPSWSGTRLPWPPPPRRTSSASTSDRPGTGPTNS